MIVGIGLDLVTVARIRHFHERWDDNGLRRIFTAAEIAYCVTMVDPAPSFAARFAAKEAFFKAMGTGWGVGGALCEVEVRRARSGDPGLAISGQAAETFARTGAQQIHLSLTHTAETAAAVVVLER